MRSDVRQIRIDGQHYKNVIHNRLVHDVISIDVDIQSKMLYIADFLNQSIIRASLENNDKIEHIVKNVQKLEGIAFDWISKKIYWISTHPTCMFLHLLTSTICLLISKQKIQSKFILIESFVTDRVSFPFLNAIVTDKILIFIWQLDVQYSMLYKNCIRLFIRCMRRFEYNQ